MHMVDLMSSIVCEGDSVSQELLDTVLVNLVPAHKVRSTSQKHRWQIKKSHITRSLITFILQNLNKQAYDLAKALLKRTAQAIEPYITNVSICDA